MKLFKRINPRFYGGRSPLDKHIIKSRLDIYEILKTKDYGQGLKNVYKDEEMYNLILLGRLVNSITKCNPENYEIKSWTRDQISIKVNSDDIMYRLVGNVRISSSLEMIRDLDLVLADYDFKGEMSTFYFNTRASGPLRIRNIGDIQVLYKGYTQYQLDDFLNNIAYDLGEYFSFGEPYFIGQSTAWSLKHEIVSRYIGIYIDGRDDQVFKYIIEDAYNDLTRLSSIYMSESKEERYKWLTGLRESFKDNLNCSITRGYYIPFISQKEEDDYDNLIKTYVVGFNRMGQYLKRPEGDIPFDIKGYYLFDQDKAKANRLKMDFGYIKNRVMELAQYNKVIRSIINEIHPDIIVGIYLLFCHLELIGLSKLYTQGSYFQQLIGLIISKDFRFKPLLIKNLFKNVCDDLLHDMKEKGLISMHQLENFFGYRTAVTILEEVKEDYLKWFNQGLEKYSDIQYSFIKKWAPEFFKMVGYKGVQVGDKLVDNLHHYKDFESILGHELQFMTGHGVVDDYHVETVDGKNRSISKNSFFKLFKDAKDFRTNVENEEVRRNKVIIKREELIKQRIVINSSLNTFVPLSQINKFMSVAFAGTGITYLFNTKEQKAEHYVRLENYLLYNKNVKRKYLCMPLDYSSYDHTITLGFIKGVIEAVGEYTGFKDQLSGLYNQFEGILNKEVIYFKELGSDPENNQKYKYGILSGWKITSSVESIGNAITSYGIMRENGLELVDLETMGDDLIIVVEEHELDRKQQLEVLTRVCNSYEKLGFIMNVPKNSVGYDFLEFLRVTFRAGSVQCYPTRILGAMVYLKPSKEEANFGIPEIQAICKKVCKRYGIRSRYIKVAEMFLRGYKNDNLRQFGVGYLAEPNRYELLREEKELYRYRVDDIKQTPAYKFYVSILGEDLSSEIIRIIDLYIVRKTVQRTKIKPVKKKEQKLTAKEISFISALFKGFTKKYYRTENHMHIYIPDYHMGILLVRYMRKNKTLGFKAIQEKFLAINKKLYEIKLLRDQDYSNNIISISNSRDLKELEGKIMDERILSSEKGIPSLIFSRVKKLFISYLHEVLYKSPVNSIAYQIIRQILHKSRSYIMKEIIGELLSEKSEIIGLSSGIPIGFMAD